MTFDPVNPPMAVSQSLVLEALDNPAFWAECHEVAGTTFYKLTPRVAAFFRSHAAGLAARKLTGESAQRRGKLLDLLRPVVGWAETYYPAEVLRKAAEQKRPLPTLDNFCPFVDESPQALEIVEESAYAA